MITSMKLRHFNAWMDGSRRFSRQYREAVKPGLDEALQKFFQDTQNRVHVLTGELKGSGTVQMFRGQGEDLVGTVTYTSDHAMYEMARGGEHDFFTEPMMNALPSFAEACDNKFEAVMNTWS